MQVGLEFFPGLLLELLSQLRISFKMIFRQFQVFQAYLSFSRGGGSQNSNCPNLEFVPIRSEGGGIIKLPSSALQLQLQLKLSWKLT